MHDRGHQWGIPAVFMRGGTSKAIIFKQSDLPEDEGLRRQIFLSAMGSPDPHGRQLDGMGGGLSSLSKICIVGPSLREDADVDYTFVQIGIKDDAVDYDSACGNMTSAIGPFAVDEGLVGKLEDGEVTIRIHATNMGQIIHSRFFVRDGLAVVSGERKIIGVSDSGAGIMLDFIEPGNTRGGGLLPGSKGPTQFELPDGSLIDALLVDCGNPYVFVRAQDLGLVGCEMPDALDANLDLMKNLEHLRRAASIKMSVANNTEQAGEIQSVPKIALVSQPADYRALSGEAISATSYDISVRMISMGQAHRAIPVTGALCVATAARLRNTLVGNVVSANGPIDLKVGTPSGVIEVNAIVDLTQDDNPQVKQASLWRTTRVLMEGLVLVPKEKLEK